MRNLSTRALQASQNVHSDEVWLMLLTIDHADILDGPILCVNDMQNLFVAPANNIAFPEPDDWTPGTGMAVEALGTTAWRLSDSGSAAASIDCLTSGLATGNQTHFLKVQRDRVGRATRYPAFTVSDANGTSTVYLDTNTGTSSVASTGTGHAAAGAVENGDGWLVYLTRSGSTAQTLQVKPAAGANATLGSGLSDSTTGSIIVTRPTLFPGVWADVTEFQAYPFQIDLPGEDMEQPTSARLRIDNVDRQIVEAVRGLTSAPSLTVAVVLASQPEVKEIEFADLTMRACDYDALYVEGTLTYEQIFTEPVTLEMTPSRFPGLF